MKICQITHGRVNPDGENGITRTVYNLNKQLNAKNWKSEIYSFVDDQNCVEDFVRDKYTTVKLFPRVKFFGTNEFRDFILSDKFDFDVVHFHLMWMMDKNTILNALKKRNIPYVITTHAAYTPDRIDSMKKKISMNTLEKSYLLNAKVIHALCNEEKDFLKNLKIEAPIHVIANGISKVEVKKINEAKLLENPYDPRYLNIVWVGRIREDKNVLGIVESLLYLDKEVKSKVRVHIVGNGIDSYIKRVERFIEKHNLGENVVLYGPRFKQEKYRFILNADIYLQPSFSEGISFSILDAMACELPMILSRQTNMTYYFNRDFYKMCEPYPDDIADSILELFEDVDRRRNLGLSAKKMIDTTFNWDSLIDSYQKMYKRAKN